MNNIRKTLLALSLALPTAAVLADPAPQQLAPAVTPQVAAAGAHLGVRVRNIPPFMAAQLPVEVARGQGIMIVQIQPDSPAAKAGLQNYDVLLSYDDQKLFSPDQLSALVASDQPGRKVTLQVVCNGKVQSLQVQLGQRSAPPAMPMPRPWQRAPWQMPHPMMPPMQGPEQTPGNVNGTFESLNVERLDNGRYRAAIEYIGPDGKKLSHVYEGSRNDLRQQIQQSQDLPMPARKQLLNALGMHLRLPPMPLPGFDGPFDPDQLMQQWREHGWGR